MTGALDPFHDFQYHPEGVPDQYSGPSVVQFLKRKITISKPAALAAGAQWDAHFFTAPIMKTMNGVAGAYLPGNYREYTAWAGSLGTVNVVTCLSGGRSLPLTVNDSPPTNYTSQSFSPCDLGNDYSMMRIIGGGFEVHNDTAELYLNGSVSVYSQPNESDFQFTVLGIAGDSGSGGLHKTRMPPSILSEAVSNVNSRTWEAKHGTYTTFQLDIEKLGFEQATGQPVVMCKTDQSLDYVLASPTFSSDCELVAQPDGLYPFKAFRSVVPVRRAAIETSGAYFTGLDEHSVLTLDIVFIVEIAPTPANQTLISLATPSALYDPEALVLYSRALRELPPGVKASMNASGDWWKMVSGAINFVAPVLAKMGPYGAAAAGAARAGQIVGNSVIEVRRQKQERREAEQAKRNTSQPRAPPKIPPSPAAKAAKQKVKTN